MKQRSVADAPEAGLASCCKCGGCLAFGVGLVLGLGFVGRWRLLRLMPRVSQLLLEERATWALRSMDNAVCALRLEELAGLLCATGDPLALLQLDGDGAWRNGDHN